MEPWHIRYCRKADNDTKTITSSYLGHNVGIKETERNHCWPCIYACYLPLIFSIFVSGAYYPVVLRLWLLLVIYRLTKKLMMVLKFYLCMSFFPFAHHHLKFICGKKRDFFCLSYQCTLQTDHFLYVLPTEQELIPEYWVNIFRPSVRPCVRLSVRPSPTD